MTDILCRWLNDELQLSKRISQASFAREFASGYLIGEVLRKYQLQDDFDQFSQSKTADSKLNNFTRLEPMLHLLGIPFDTQLARDIMTEKHGTATRLLYQMYISLNNKKKANLTGVAMETLRPTAPAKLGVVESQIYKERLKHATPRQTDLNLEALVGRFHEHQIKMEQTAFRERFEEMERQYQQRMNDRAALIDRSRKLREKQSELVAKINAATVHIPKPPSDRTLKAIEGRKNMRRKREADETTRSIHNFEEKMKMILPPSDENDEIDIQYIMTRDEDRGEPIHMLKVAPNDEYIGKIRKRLKEDASAREEREKRRRKVLGDQMNAHQAQEEARREEMMVNRLMRQSQQERRIAVQLLQARHEKEVIRQNRILREKQYQDRRLKDFEDALDREAEMAALQKLEYQEQIKAEQELHDQIATQRAEERYTRHYDMCEEIMGSIVDFACKVAEYRDLTNNLLPAKLMRDWKLLFTSGQPLYEQVEPEVTELTPEQVLEEDRQQLLDEGDFMEYKGMNGEWQPPETVEIQEPPRDNPVVGHIVHRLFNIVHPPTPPPPPPEFPPFPIRACVLGKIFSGKTSCVKRLAEEHRLEVLVPEQLVHEAVEAHKAGEVETQEQSTQADFEDDNDETLSGQEPSTEVAVAEGPVQEATTEDVPSQGEAAAASTTPGGESTVTENTPVINDPPRTASSTKRESSELSKSSSNLKKIKENKPQPTPRAKLGSKALKFLKKGRPVDDQIVVDTIVEAIRRVPEGSGWVLDGYPQNYNQAKMLEKALSGYDANAREVTKKEPKKTRKSSLVPDPRPPPPPPEPPSGIDVVVLFDIRDELCLKRAAGRTEQLQAEKTFHEEFNPPPEGSATGVGKTEKVQPVTDPAYDQEQIQTRVTGFLDQWPKLEKWFQRFGTLKTVDASLEKEAVFLETEKILEDTLAKIEKKGQEEIQPEIEKPEEKEAPGAPEVPVEPVPEEPAPGGPEVRTSRPSSKTGSRAESGEAKEAEHSKSGSAEKSDGTGKIPSESGEKQGSDEKPGSQAKSDSQGKPGSDTKPESDTKQTADLPESFGADIEFDVNIMVDLNKLKAEDKEGSAKSGGSSKDKKSKSPKGKKSDAGSAKGKSSRGSSPKSAGKKGSKKSKTPEPEPEPEPEVPTGPPPPKPGDEEWEFVDLDLDPDLAKVLVLHWEETEKAYVNNCKTVFRNVRSERENIYRYFFQIRKDFMQYLRRPDCKQEYVEQWQKAFNEVPDDMREDEETKAELHQQVDDLKERLWNICDERKEQAEKEREQNMNDGWLEDRLGILSNHYITVMQSEVDRLQDTMRMLKDYYRGMDGIVPDALNPDYERLPLIELPVERPETPEKAGSETAQTPDEDSKSERSGSARSKSPKGSRSKSPKDRAKSPKGSRSSRAASGKKKKGGKETPQPEPPKSSEGIGRRIVIPLVPRRPVSPDGDVKVGTTPSKDKKDKKGAKKGPGVEDVPGAESPAPPQDLDEKLLYDSFNYAVNAISQMSAEIQAEMQAREAEEEAERLREQEKEKEKEKTKGPKAAKGGKKGKSRSPSPKKGGKGKDSESSATPPPAPSEVSEEDQQKKSAKERAREEFYFAIQEEEQATKTRLELIRILACAVLQDLKTKGEEAFKDMNDWLGARFLKEMESIDQMSEIMRNAIENCEKIKNEICLDQDNFILDEDLKVLKTPSPEPPPLPEEQHIADQFTVTQLTTLYEQFRATAPTGIISNKAFTEMFENLVSVTHGMGTLPDTWMQLTPSQIQELGNTLSSDSDYVDWRRLLVALCYPIPTPTQQELLCCLERFKEMDQKSTGSVTREQWQRMTLWFKPEQDNPVGFDRLGNLQRILFEMFADHTGSIPLLAYKSFLMYFSAAPNYHEGFLRALSVASGQHMPRLGKPSLASQAVPLERAASAVDSIIQEGTEFKDEDKNGSEPPMSDEVIPEEANDALVSAEALFAVLHHGEVSKGDSHRFSVTADPEDHTSIERLSAVFQELNEDDSTSPIMYRILIDHPVIQDVVVGCKHFKALDIKALMSGPSNDAAEVTSLKTMD